MTIVVEPPQRLGHEAAKHFEQCLAQFYFVYRHLRFPQIYLLWYED
jgi:hypothetical protein